jgi:hypothetical protein
VELQRIVALPLSICADDVRPDYAINRQEGGAQAMTHDKLIADAARAIEAAFYKAVDAGTNAEGFIPIATAALASSEKLIAELEARIVDMEDELYDAKQGPWPQWAKSMLDTLDGFTDNALTRSGDAIDLPEELKSWLDDYRIAALNEDKPHD